MSTKKAVTAHYMFHWGVPKQVHLRNEPLQKLRELAIMKFHSKETEGQYGFASNGMSDFLQSSNQTFYRTELYLCATTSEEWIINLLAAVVRYPTQQETNLHEFDTIFVEEPIDGQSSPFTATILDGLLEDIHKRPHLYL